MSLNMLLAGVSISIALLAGPMVGYAGELAAPKGEVVLTVTGKITNTNGDGAARFDMAMLDALEGRAATLETPWTTGKVTFEGPFGRSLLKAVGAEGSVLKITALNDYSANVPVEDLRDHDTILATRFNGKLMSVREKGPIFLIYPFDKEANLYTEAYFSRSVWQIKSITVE
jgi:hypothetical protein